MVIQFTVTIQIKIVNHLSEILRLKFSITILSLKMSELARPNETIAVSIKAFESCIWFKIPHCSQYLPKLLYLNLLLCIVNQDLLHLQFGFVTKHLYHLVIFFYPLMS